MIKESNEEVVEEVVSYEEDTDASESEAEPLRQTVTVEQIKNNEMFKQISGLLPISEDVIANKVLEFINSGNLEDKIKEVVSLLEAKSINFIKSFSKSSSEITYSEELIKKAGILSWIGKNNPYTAYMTRLVALMRFLVDSSVPIVSKGLILLLIVYATNPVSIAYAVGTLGFTSLSDVAFYGLIRLIFKLTSETSYKALNKHVDDVKAEIESGSLLSNQTPDQDVIDKEEEEDSEEDSWSFEGGHDDDDEDSLFVYEEDNNEEDNNEQDNNEQDHQDINAEQDNQETNTEGNRRTVVDDDGYNKLNDLEKCYEAQNVDLKKYYGFLTDLSSTEFNRKSDNKQETVKRLLDKWSSLLLDTDEVIYNDEGKLDNDQFLSTRNIMNILSSNSNPDSFGMDSKDTCKQMFVEIKAKLDLFLNILSSIKAGAVSVTFEENYEDDEYDRETQSNQFETEPVNEEDETVNTFSINFNSRVPQVAVLLKAYHDLGGEVLKRTMKAAFKTEREEDLNDKLVDGKRKKGAPTVYVDPKKEKEELKKLYCYIKDKKDQFEAENYKDYIVSIRNWEDKINTAVNNIFEELDGIDSIDGFKDCGEESSEEESGSEETQEVQSNPISPFNNLRNSKKDLLNKLLKVSDELFESGYIKEATKLDEIIGKEYEKFSK